ncbi:MAG: magnesium transporter CorA family protein [Candidatus Kerfeldbacteria bacterium]|nr:magnesium transporter CorA family protein [Candidatus Kerfeldbacteria bacterium]
MARNENTNSSLRWIDLQKPSEAELNALGEEFHFHPLDIADCKKPGQRQKVERYHDYAFLVLLFPVYNRQTRAIESGEVDFFVGPDFLITVHEGTLAPVRHLFQEFASDQAIRQQSVTSAALLHNIIDRLLVALYPMLDHVSLDIHTAEQQVFAGNEKRMLREITLLRRNITDFRRIVQTHKNTLKRLVEILKLNGLHGARETIPSFEDSIDRSKEVWDLLESYRESIDTLYETNESLMSYKLNDIMRTFTTMSVIIFFMTLVATLFAVRARGTPFLNNNFAFWILLAIVTLAGGAARQFFKKRQLLE